MMTNLSGKSVIISGTGSYAPDTILTNDDLSKQVDTSDEWIRTRTGIRERRIAGEKESTSDMAAKAAEKAIESAGIDPDKIGLTIVGTATPDLAFPSTACFVQQKLKLAKGPAMDLGAACSGFLYCMEVARSLMLVNGIQHALVIGSEKMSSITNWEDRGTCVLFGDGAGAVVLSLSHEENTGILQSLLGADGQETDILCVPNGQYLESFGDQAESMTADKIHMQGNQVFKHAVRVMCQSALDILEQTETAPEEIALVVPHQANIRIIEALSQRLKLDMERFFINLDRFGNTSAASIPIALDEAFHAKKINSGDKILLVSFGAGLTWGASLLQWPS